MESKTESGDSDSETANNVHNPCSGNPAKDLDTSDAVSCSGDNNHVHKDDDIVEEEAIKCDDVHMNDEKGAAAASDNEACQENDDSLTLGTLKKDDSGIVLERSPVKDGMSEEGDMSRTDSDILDVKQQVVPGRPSVSNESEGLVADFEDCENVLQCDLSNDSNTASASSENRLESEETQAKDDDSDNNDSNSEDMTSAMRRHRRSSQLSSSDSSDNESNHSDSSTNSKSSQSEEETNMEVDWDPPKDTWHALPELTKRELGYSNRMHMPHMFRTHVGGSVEFVRRLELMHKMEHHEGCVNALHFNSQGTLLASGSDDLNIVLWNWALNKPYVVFDSGHRSNVFQSKFVPYSGDSHVVSCARDGQVRLAELSSTGICKATRKLAQHRGAAHKLALLQDSTHVFYSSGEDAVTFQVDLREEKPTKLCITKENDKKIALYSIHANPFKTHEFCVGGRDHFIRIYDKRMIVQNEEEAPVKKFCPHHLVDSDVKANVTCAVYSYNGTEVLGTYNDEDIYLFDTGHSDGADHIHKYIGHRNNATVKGVNFYGPRSEFIISGSDCSNVFLWEKESEKIVQYFTADDGGVVNVLEPHPHAPILATSGLDHDVKVWMPTAEEATKLGGIKQTMKKNKKEREEDRSHEPEMIDGQMLWFLMQHLRRSRRAGRREGEEENNQSSSSSNSGDESDDSQDMPEPMQCAPS